MAEGGAPPVLPKLRELSPTQLLLLQEHLRTQEDADLLALGLRQTCSHLHSNLASLRRKLTALSISWISQSFSINSDLRRITAHLQNLTLQTDPCVINEKIGKMFGDDLLLLIRQVQRIETIREYAETTLQLEAVVGDLEDAVICVVNQHATKNMSSRKILSTPILDDFGAKQKQLLQAVNSMCSIENVLVNVAKSRPQWCHLLNSVDARVGKSLAVLRPQVLTDHRSLLISLGWPPKLAKIEMGEAHGLTNPLVLMGERREWYSLSFQTVSALQHLQMRREKRLLKHLGQKEEQKLTLWAINELVSPIASRVEHHFSKWVEQPEFIFALVYKISMGFLLSLDYTLQPLIDRAGVLSCSVKEAWVSAIVQMLVAYLEKKVFSLLAKRYEEKHMRSDVSSSWLHLIDLCVDFDRQMQLLLKDETYLFLAEPEKGFTGGISVLSIFCERPKWLKLWAKIELKVAVNKLKAESKNERVWSIFYEQGGAEFHLGTETEQFVLLNREDFRAPLIADCALGIAWEFIERCQSLPSILSRVKFIRLTASRFLWYFFEVLLFRGKRAEPPPGILDDGDEILLRVSGLINAARYLEAKLQEWSDDANILELRVAEIGSEAQTEDAGHESLFFWEEMKSLSELETNWLMEIISDILYQFDTLSSVYFQKSEHIRTEEDLCSIRFSEDELVVSIHFVKALDVLRTSLFAAKLKLNRNDFLDLWRSVADGLDCFVMSSVLASDAKFSAEGFSRFQADMQALLFVFRSFCTRPEAFFPCIRDFLRLLEMNIEEVKHLLVGLSNEESSTKWLCLCGISRISSDEVKKILSRRNS